jgi:hypothetical protein
LAADTQVPQSSSFDYLICVKGEKDSRAQPERVKRLFRHKS